MFLRVCVDGGRLPFRQGLFPVQLVLCASRARCMAWRQMPAVCVLPATRYNNVRPSSRASSSRPSRDMNHTRYSGRQSPSRS